jgi:hypothetical protein
MGKTIMGATVSLDGFIANDNDGVGPLFDWYGNGDVTWRFPGSDDEARSTQASETIWASRLATSSSMTYMVGSSRTVGDPVCWCGIVLVGGCLVLSTSGWG